MNNQNQAISEMQRRLANVIRYGTVSEVDTASAKCRVKLGKSLFTGWLPWQTIAANSTLSTWSAPKIGEQVIVLSPSGSLGAAFVLTALYKSDHPAPATEETKHTITFVDGTKVEYDTSTQTLHFESSGDVTIKAAGNINMEASGNIKLTGARIDLN